MWVCVLFVYVKAFCIFLLIQAHTITSTYFHICRVKSYSISSSEPYHFVTESFHFSHCTWIQNCWMYISNCMKLTSRDWILWGNVRFIVIILIIYKWKTIEYMSTIYANSSFRFSNLICEWHTDAHTCKTSMKIYVHSFGLRNE